MTESSKHTVSPEMARLIDEGNWTAVELLEEAQVAERAALPRPRVEIAKNVEPAETPEDHSCPLDIIDARARESAIRAGRLDAADEIDADTIRRHTGCVRGEGPGALACEKVLEILDADSQDRNPGEFDYELFG